MNELEPRVAGCERRLNMFDRLFRNLRPLVQQAYQGVRDGQDPYGQGPDGASGPIARAKATSNIASGTVDNPGIGTATLTLTGRTTVVYSIYDRTIKAGAGMVLGKEEGKWLVLSVDSCNSLVVPSAGDEGELPDISDHVFGAEGPSARSGYVRGFEEIGGPVEVSTAVTRAQHTLATNVGTTLSASFGQPTAPGSLLVAVVASESGTAPAVPAGWTQAVAASGRVFIWYRANAPATTTVTASQSSATWCLEILEYRNAPASPTVLTHAATPTSTSPISAGSVSPAAAAIVVAGFTNDNADAFTSPTGGFAIIDQGQAGGTNQLAALDRIAAAGTYTAGASFPGGDTAVAAIASFA